MDNAIGHLMEHLESHGTTEPWCAAAAEIKRLRRILQQFADNQLSDENCASVEVAARRIRGLARAALQGRD